MTTDWKDILWDDGYSEWPVNKQRLTEELVLDVWQVSPGGLVGWAVSRRGGGLVEEDIATGDCETVEEAIAAAEKAAGGEP